jgi:CDP-diacylglycerol--serine O-phosphatidyltransferase
MKKEKRKLRVNRAKKGIYLLPNLITTASLFCGFFAIIAAINGDFFSSAVAILVACFFDGADGKIARLTHATSRFGTEYDSLSDLISFGIAPGILIFLWTLQPYGRFGWLTSFLYVACCALRLARFNTQVGGIEGRYFRGLPTTGAAFFVAAVVLLFYRLGGGKEPSPVIILVIVYSLSFLMVSTIKFSNLGDLELFKRKPFSFLATAILISMVVAAEPQIILFTLSLVYILSGPVWAISSLKKRKMEEIPDRSEGLRNS